jgi:hypothetical protein
MIVRSPKGYEMTTERLVEAINAHNAETGIQDVIKAAKITLNRLGSLYNNIGLVRGNNTHCVLAKGWKNGREEVKVFYDTFWIFQTEEELENHSYKNIKHEFFDVVQWFDSYSNSYTAAVDVLELLKEYDND